jgi:hypothetical protein
LQRVPHINLYQLLRLFLLRDDLLTLDNCLSQLCLGGFSADSEIECDTYPKRGEVISPNIGEGISYQSIYQCKLRDA